MRQNNNLWKIVYSNLSNSQKNSQLKTLLLFSETKKVLYGRFNGARTIVCCYYHYLVKVVPWCCNQSSLFPAILSISWYLWQLTCLLWSILKLRYSIHNQQNSDFRNSSHSWQCTPTYYCYSHCWEDSSFFYHPHSSDVAYDISMFFISRNGFNVIGLGVMIKLITAMLN